MLGKRQEIILKSLREQNGWYPGCGWNWTNRSTTEIILDSLVRRGYAKKQQKRCLYTITESGKRFLDSKDPFYRYQQTAEASS